MTGNSDVSALIEALEVRVAHQERVIEDLNATVTEQWALIEKLSKRVAGLDDQLAELDRPALASTADVRPPHY